MIIKPMNEWLVVRVLCILKMKGPSLPSEVPLDAVNSPTYTELKQALKDGLITERQADIFLAPRPNEELYDLINDPYQFNNLMLGSEIPKIYITLKQKLEEWSIATGDNLPENLTKDWYLREPVKNNEKNIKKKTSNRTENHGVRGEMPGFANDAIRINAKGPFKTSNETFFILHIIILNFLFSN